MVNCLSPEDRERQRSFMSMNECDNSHTPQKDERQDLRREKKTENGVEGQKILCDRRNKI